jgi:3-phosphoshikimate 1-carboxyvinyltransferase
LGASIREEQDVLLVEGTGGAPKVPANVIDVANSGTTLYILMGIAALCGGWTVFTGDEQIRNRPVSALIQSLNSLGAEAFTTRGGESPPVVIRGPLKGGRTSIACPTSQYLTSLLISCPLAKEDTEIVVTELNERPYIDMTLSWLESQGIVSSRDEMKRFRIPGGQSYSAFEREIPGDYSSATFFMCAAAVTGGDVLLQGLDPEDSQGDKQVLSILQDMGCEVIYEEDGIRVRGGSLVGRTVDLNSIPDALPALAVTACFAEGKTRLINVPQARLKETDRIAVMREELQKMGARAAELEDGLEIEGGPLTGCAVDGHSDHRIVMALAVGGLGASGDTRISTAEAVSVTFPDFFRLLDDTGAS